jgi:hypothetical protein
MEGSEHRNTTRKEKNAYSLIAMTSEFMLPFKHCHKNLSSKFKVKTTLSERDCHSTESSLQR